MGFLEKSAKAWKPAKGESRVEILRRDLNSLLNKVCPENIATIVERIVNTQIGTVEELEVLIKLIFEKALAQPHYCVTYADMVFALHQWMPEFPSEGTGKPVNFRTCLLNTCQTEFESLESVLTMTPKSLEGLTQDDIEHQRSKRKGRVLA